MLYCWFSSGLKLEGPEPIRQGKPINYGEFRLECWRSIHQSGSAITIVLNFAILALEVLFSFLFYPLPLVKLLLVHGAIHVGELWAQSVVGRGRRSYIGLTVCLSFVYLSFLGGALAALIDSILPVGVFWAIGICLIVGTGVYPNQTAYASAFSVGAALCFLTPYFWFHSGAAVFVNIGMVIFFLVACVVTSFGSSSYDWVLADAFHTRRDMEEAKRQLAVTLHDIGDGVVTTDTQGRITLFNRQAQEMTGWGEAEANGRLVGEVLPWTQFECQGWSGPRELQISDRGGKQLWVSVTLSRLDGDILSFQDITARKQLESERLIASKMEGLSLLAGGIAHDFNNYLTVIRGHATLLLDNSSLDSEVHRSMEGIEGAAVRANRLANQLLTFAKGGAPAKEAHSVADLLDRSLAFSLSGSQVRLDSHCPDDLWWVGVDADQMSQVFQNLALNSVYAMPGGGVLRVRASNVQVESGSAQLKKGSYVLIEVRDSGRGIPPAILPKIFDPYFTTKPGGTGLGLATVYSIVTRHQGRVEVESVENLGTTFRIYLPATELPSIAETSKDIRPLKRGGRILVMDDESSVQKVLSKMLLRLGFDCTVTENGEQAIEAYRKSQDEEAFRCVILDLTVPGGMGGEKTLQELLKINPNILAIVASGYATESVMANYQEWGFKVRLPKPFGLSQLEEALKRALSDEGM